MVWLSLIRIARPLALAAAVALAGCAAGPDFKAPPPPNTGGYVDHPPTTTSEAADAAGGAAQRFDAGADIPGDWWTLFHSPALNALVEKALRNNHDLKAAQAALKAAQEAVLAQRGSFLPSVSAGFDANRQRQPGSLAPVPSNNAFQYSLFTPQLDISWAPDLFGLQRRTRESLAAQAEATRFQMLAAWTTLGSNVVVTAVQLAALQEQADASRQAIDAERQLLGTLRLRLAKGDASKLDVAAQQAQLAQAEAALPPLAKQVAQTRHALAVLVGRFPADAPAPTFTLADLRLPQDLPLSLPSQLVAQRPDVRMARAELHAASATIGIAAAERLPQIELTANAGSTALAISRVFDSGTGFWGIAASLAAPILEGGALRHQERAARAAYVEAAEQYRSTVLGAFRDVADTLVALQQDARALQAAVHAEAAARTTLDLSQRQLRDGAIGAFELLNAEQAYQQARIARIAATGNRFADTAALYQALGGGWWHHPQLAEGTHGR